MAPKSLNIQHLGLYVSFLIGILILTGCDHRDYLAQKTFDKVCWSSSDALNFSIELTKQTYLPLYIQFGPDYSYQNIYLKLSYSEPSGTSKEILLNQLISDKLGNWLVERQGATYSFELAQAFQLDVKEAGTYQLSLSQYMREDNLCGVEKIGVIRPKK